MNRIEVHQFAEHKALELNVREHVAWLDQQIAKVEKDIDDHIDRNPDLKEDVDLITSIPGLGRGTAAKIIGHLGNIRRFENAKALAAFIGVTPRQRTSGSSVRGRTMISRMGNNQLRAALFMPSLVARRYNPLLNAFAERLLNTGMPKMAVIGAVMRKLVHQIYGVIRSGQPFNANILQGGLVFKTVSDPMPDPGYD